MALLIYSYARGNRSSRGIERACREDVTYKVITAMRVPDHSTIAEFRRRHERGLAELFTSADGTRLEITWKTPAYDRAGNQAIDPRPAVRATAGGAEEAAVLQESGSRGLDQSLLRPTARSQPAASSRLGAAKLTVVVPTRNERDNVAALVARLERLHPELRLEILFVDDSDDDTPGVIRAVAAECSPRIGVVHRPPGRRDGGLGGAVLAGIRAARSEWICVMDADLQHPPELLVALLEEGRRSKADLVVASRYCPGGDVGDLSAPRVALSRSSGLLARAMFPRRLRNVSDPLSGFFLVRRAALDLTNLRPRGFKILLEILVRGGPLRTSEIAFRFAERHAGDSKASLREGIRYLRRLIELRVGSGRSHALPAQPQPDPAVVSVRRWRFRHEAPAAWNRNGTAGDDHAPQRSVLT